MTRVGIFANLLSARAKEGVPVYVIMIRWVASIRIEDVRADAGRGVRLAEFHPIKPWNANTVGDLQSGSSQAAFNWMTTEAGLGG